MILRRGGDRVEADIDEIIVQIGWHREGYAFLDMGEGRIFGRRRHGHRDANELGDDRLGVRGGVSGQVLHERAGQKEHTIIAVALVPDIHVKAKEKAHKS